MPPIFPGMDPYIEGPLWTTFHFTLGSELVRQLAPQLQPNYLVLPVERFVVDMVEDISITRSDVIPDVGVAEIEPALAPANIANISAPLQLATIIPPSTPHVSIEIRDVAQRRLVTAIEILSPTNKRSQGRDEYVEKRTRILQSDTHLLEIDLLRGGVRIPMESALPTAPYFVFLSRSNNRPITDIWPIHLNQPLPDKIPVPLANGDSDAIIGLQAAMTAIYDLLRYDLAIDYSQPLRPALDADARKWVKDLLSSR